MGVLNREPHPTVVIYYQIWTKTGKNTNKNVKDYILVSSHLLMFGESAITWQYVGVSVLLSVGLQVSCQFGKVCANFIQFLHKTKHLQPIKKLNPSSGLKKKKNILITSNSSIKPLLSLAASCWQCEQNSCRIWALENVCTLQGMILLKMTKTVRINSTADYRP